MNNLLNVSSVDNISSISVIDIHGKSLAASSFLRENKQANIDISFLNSGIYFVKILIQDRVITKKIKVLN